MEQKTTKEPFKPPNIPVVQSPTNENLNTVLEASKDEEGQDPNKTDDPIPKVSNEARHSVGSYIVPHRERISRLSGSLNVGGGRNKRPSHSEILLAKSQSEIQVNTTNSLSVSQTSKNSLTYSSSGTFYDHSRKKVDVRVPPKPAQPTSKDATDFRQMEQGLVQLLEDFHCGKLEGFGRNCTFEQMENVREQQEKLARLHFDLNAQQEVCGYLRNVQHTDEGIQMAKGNLSKLIENLQRLSQSIEELQSDSSTIENRK